MSLFFIPGTFLGETGGFLDPVVSWERDSQRDFSCDTSGIGLGTNIAKKRSK